MGILSGLFGSGDYPLDPKADAKAKARGRKNAGKKVKGSVKASNKKNKQPTSDERGHGATGGGFWS